MNKNIKPNCIIIGAAKAGTTFLYNLLSQHPDILASKAKELTFFTNTKHYETPYPYLNIQYSNYSGEKILMDNTPEYLLKSYCASRIYSFSGADTKLICMVRNPAKRAYSHYNMMKLIGREDDSFKDAINDEIYNMGRGRPTYKPFKRVERDYVKRGMYIDSLIDFLKYYEKKNIHIIVFEDFIKDPIKHLKILETYLGINKYTAYDFSVSKNPSLNSRPTILTRPLHGIIYMLRKYGINTTHETNYLFRKLSSRKLKGPRERISKEMLENLTNYYLDSILRLEKEFNLNLSKWKNPD